MRIPFATQLFSRDGTLTKDAHLRNAYAEVRGKASAIRRRPGLVDKGLIVSGSAQLLACWDGLLSVIGSTLSSLLLNTSSGEGTYESDTLDTSGDLVYITGTGRIGSKFFVSFFDEDTFATSHYYGDHVGGYAVSTAISNTVGIGITANSATSVVAFLWDSVIDAYSSTLIRSLNSGAPTFSTVVTESGTSRALNVKYLGSRFIATFRAGDDTVVYWSLNDGLTWLSATVVGVYLPGICYDGVLWRFYGEDSATFASVGYSTADFSTFSVLTLSGITGRIQEAAYADGVYRVRVLALSANYTSTDGSAFVSDSTHSFEYLWQEVSGSYGAKLVSGITYALYLLSATPTIKASFPLSDEPLTFRWISGDGSLFCAPSGLALTDVLTITLVEAGETVTPTTISTLTDAFMSSSFSGSARSTQQLLLKSAEKLWIYSAGGSAVLVTDIDYPGKHTYSITSLTRVSTTATATTSVTHGLSSGQSVLIAGASPAGYNGTVVITVTDSTHFTYTVADGITTPATGTITAYGGKTTVPGVVYLDGYFFVMTTEGIVYNSALGDGSSWDALDFLTAESEPGDGVALVKTGSYVAALKEWSTELFYDAGNATGSPLSPVSNATTLLGCASGQSVAYLEDNVFYISQTKDKGRSIALMQNSQQTLLSTPDVERILALSTLATVYAYGLRIAGHGFYVLTLVDLDVTLVFDMTSKLWCTWSSLTAATPVTVTSLTRSGTTVTVVASAHGLVDGAPVTISGCDQTDYNGTVAVSIVDANTFTYEVDSSQATTGTGTIQFTAYTESYFKFTRFVQCSGRNFVLHETNGHMYEILASAETDADLPIAVRMRSSKVDGGNLNRKKQARLAVIGAQADALVLVRWTDDDYTSYSAYQRLSLAQDDFSLRRGGGFLRRAYQVQYVGAPAIELAELDIEVKE